jgi:hypothetical protein
VPDSRGLGPASTPSFLCASAAARGPIMLTFDLTEEVKSKVPIRKEARMFFFEKKNQKTFAPYEPGCCIAPGPNLQKFFAELFFKKATSFFAK